MSGSDGSTALTPEQQDWFHGKHGVRYVHVQTNADMPNRKARRRMGQRQHSHGLGALAPRLPNGASYSREALLSEDDTRINRPGVA